MLQGSCLCQKIQFEVSCDLPSVTVCHCKACRKHSGHYEASVDIPRKALKIVNGSELIKWFYSSDKARRGFCSNCGSTLFWDPIDQVKHDWTSVAMGAFDSPTGTQLKNHIFTSEKGDYYEITDDLPQILDPRKELQG